jgi:hypothetical protein
MMGEGKKLGLRNLKLESIFAVFYEFFSIIFLFDSVSIHLSPT